MLINFLYRETRVSDSSFQKTNSRGHKWCATMSVSMLCVQIDDINRENIIIKKNSLVRVFARAEGNNLPAKLFLHGLSHAPRGNLSFLHVTTIQARRCNGIFSSMSFSYRHCVPKASFIPFIGS